MTVKPLAWQDWADHAVYRSWDDCQEMRKAETPFGPIRLLRRYRARSRSVLVGKWFVTGPGIARLGPFDDDVKATKAAEAEYERKVRECLA